MDWQRLAQAVIDRRVELGFRTREAFAAETGLSSRLLGDLERAQRDNYDRVTLARLEQALKWAPGTARHILVDRSDVDRAVGADIMAGPLVAQAKDDDPPFPDSYMPGRTRERVARLLDPDGPLDRQTRETLAALIGNACDLVDPPPAAVKQLRDEEALRQWERTAASLSGPRREPRGDDLPGAVRRDVVR